MAEVVLVKDAVLSGVELRVVDLARAKAAEVKAKVGRADKVAKAEMVKTAAKPAKSTTDSLLL